MKKLALILCFVLFASMTVVSQQSQSEAQFAPDAWFLLPILPDEGIEFDQMSSITLSPNGRFVAGAGFSNKPNTTQFTLLLWDLEMIDFASSAPPPTHYRLVESSSEVNFIGLSFSPDGEYLAVSSPEYIQILSLPDLETHYQLANPGNSWEVSLEWSTDGQLLANKQNGELLVWDYMDNHIYTRAIDFDGFRLEAFGEGWLYARSGSDGQLLICSGDLSECQQYSIRIGTLTPLAKRNQLVIQNRDGIYAWENTELTCCDFIPTHQLGILEDYYAVIYGSDQFNHVLITTFLQEGVSQTSIFDLETSEFIMTGLASVPSERGYLSIGNYLVIVQNDLHLYEMGNSGRLDRINASDFDLWDSTEKYDIPEAFRIEGAVMDDFLWILTSMGDFAVLYQVVGI